ncbi:hypothetical protein SPFL3102_02651 [Sporomusaceae bacterium FL31]|nr:hypothetical protein SPFL3101_02626 [Sporomusaceae bacterium FL31]GCE34824.1 hypothetical protein SPFL3102_02651 [Sporomusaceae bacterium]
MDIDTTKITNDLTKQILKSCGDNHAAALQVMSEVGKQLSQNGSAILMDNAKK